MTKKGGPGLLVIEKAGETLHRVIGPAVGRFVAPSDGKYRVLAVGGGGGATDDAPGGHGSGTIETAFAHAGDEFIYNVGDGGDNGADGQDTNWFLRHNGDALRSVSAEWGGGGGAGRS